MTITEPKSANASGSKPFESHGRPASTKYVFGKTNLPGGLKELPKSLQSFDVEGKIKGSNMQIFSHGDSVDRSNHDRDFGDQSQTLSSSLPISSDNQSSWKGATHKTMNNATNVDGSVYEKIDQSKMIRDEDKRSKNDEDFGKPEQQAMNTVRHKTQIKPLKDMEAERRKAAIVHTQSSLIAQIVEDTEQKLRTETMRSIQDDIAANYARIASQHKEEVKAELLRELTPKVEATLRSELVGPVKQELYSKIATSTNLREEVKYKLSVELAPIIKAELRLQLTEQMKQEVYAKADAIASARQADLMSQLVKEMGPKVEATLRQECRERLQQETKAAWDATRKEVKDKLYLNLEPSVKASLRKSLRGAVLRDLKSELLPEALDEVSHNMAAHEMALRDELEHKLEEKVKAELKEDLRESVKLELMQEIKDDQKKSFDEQPEPDYQLSQSGSQHHGQHNKNACPQVGSSKKRRHSLDDSDNDHHNDNGHDKKRIRNEVQVSERRLEKGSGGCEPKVSEKDGSSRAIDNSESGFEEDGPSLAPKNFKPRFEDETYQDEDLSTSELEGSQRNSAGHPITLESSDKENNSEDGQNEDWDQEKTLVGDLGVVEGKGDLAKEEAVEEEEEEL